MWLARTCQHEHANRVCRILAAATLKSTGWRKNIFKLDFAGRSLTTVLRAKGPSTQRTKRNALGQRIHTECLTVCPLTPRTCWSSCASRPVNEHWEKGKVDIKQAKANIYIYICKYSTQERFLKQHSRTINLHQLQATKLTLPKKRTDMVESGRVGHKMAQGAFHFGP